MTLDGVVLILIWWCALNTIVVAYGVFVGKRRNPR